MRGCVDVSCRLLCVALFSLVGCGTELVPADAVSQREDGKSGAVSAAGASTRQDANQDCLRLSAQASGSASDLSARGGPNGEPLPPQVGALPPCGVQNPPPAGAVVPPAVNPGVPAVPGQAVPEPLPPLGQPPLSPSVPGACASQCGCKVGKPWGLKGGAWGKGGIRGGKKP